MKSKLMIAAWMSALLGMTAAVTYAAPDDAMMKVAQQQREPLLATLKDLVAIESGSGDREALHVCAGDSVPLRQRARLLWT